MCWLLYLFFYLILSGFLYLSILEFTARRKPGYVIAKSLPGPRIYWIVGSLWDILFISSSQLFRLQRLHAKEFKTTYASWFLGDLAIHILKPQHVEVILSSPQYIEKSFMYEYLHAFLGNGLLSASGARWMHRRRILTPAFHFHILKQFYTTFTTETERLVAKINTKAKEMEVTQLQPMVAEFTHNIVCETAMGIRLRDMQGGEEYRRQIFELGKILLYRILRPWLSLNILCRVTGYARRLETVVAKAHALTRRVIRERRALFSEKQNEICGEEIENIYISEKPRHAMLDILLASQQRGENIDDEGIREEVDTFMFGGHDTTTSALTFVLLNLAHHSEIQSKAFREIREIFDEIYSDDDLTTIHLGRMKYLDCVIKETMRLYPRVPFISRIVHTEVVIDDKTFPAGTIFNIPIYDLHRDAEQFPDPEVFNPDRFLPAASTSRHPYAYIPFSAGPRNCLAQKFAMLEMKTALARILIRFRVLPVTKLEDVTFVCNLVLRTEKPIEVLFEVR